MGDSLIYVECPGCESNVSMPNKFAGERSNCPNCDQPIFVPQIIISTTNPKSNTLHKVCFILSQIIFIASLIYLYSGYNSYSFDPAYGHKQTLPFPFSLLDILSPTSYWPNPIPLFFFLVLIFILFIEFLTLRIAYSSRRKIE